MPAGVEIKAIGRVTKRGTKIEARKIQTRLHTRTIVRDGKYAFIGSQSLRHIELDARREVGVIFRDRKVVSAMQKTFHDDWESVKRPAAQDVKENAESHGKVAKRVAKAVADDLPPMAPLVKGMVKQVTGKKRRVRAEREGCTGNNQDRRERSGQGIRQRRGRRGLLMNSLMISKIFCALAIVSWQPLAAQDKPQPKVNADAAIVQDFQKRVADYHKLRKTIEQKLSTLKQTESQATIQGHEEGIAAGIREARSSAKQGDIFSPEIAGEFRRLIGIAMQGGDSKRIKESLKSCRTRATAAARER